MMDLPGRLWSGIARQNSTTAQDQNEKEALQQRFKG
jgi:hypothetical protein